MEKSDNVVSDLVFKQLMIEPENNLCFDCGQANPQWASVNNGSFICMNCAAIHKSLNIHTSFVRSLSMDTWSIVHLKHMALGGNKNLKNFLQNYDLSDESVQQRLNTRASEYYRLNLRSQCETIIFSDKQPSYDIGREQIPSDEVRTPEQIMALQHQNPNVQGSEDANYSTTDVLNSGYNYLSYGTQKIKENASYAANVTQTRLNDAGVYEKAGQLGTQVYSAGVNAKQTVSQNAQSYTTIAGATTQATAGASYAASSLAGFGTSLWGQASYFAGGASSSAQQTTVPSNSNPRDVGFQASNAKNDLIDLNEGFQQPSQQLNDQNNDLIQMNNAPTNQIEKIQQ